MKKYDLIKFFLFIHKNVERDDLMMVELEILLFDKQNF